MKLNSIVYGYIIFLHGYMGLEQQSYVACYGSTGLDNFLQPSCNAGEKIAVIGLNVLAKEISTLCPDTITPVNSDSVPDLCCQYDPGDCSVRYDTSAYRSYYKNCNGQQSCTIQVTWTYTPCNTSVYLPRTNYMKIDFYCVVDQGLDPCTDLKTTDSRVFLWNSGYPSTPLSGSSSCTCSVESSCDSEIKVIAIDLRLAAVGSCGQSITITEGSSTTEFNCTFNNDYLPTVLFSSSSHFIQLQTTDILGTADGYFLLLLQGASSGSELTLSCSSMAQSTPTNPASSLPVCPDSESTTSERTFTSTVADTTSTSYLTTTTEQTTTSVSQSVFQFSLSSVDPSTGERTTTEAKTTNLETNTDTTATKVTGSTHTSTKPTYVSLGWTSTERDKTATSVLATGTTDTSDQAYSYLKTESTTSRSVTVTEKSSKSSDNAVVIGIAVVLIVLIAVILAVIYYRDRLKECCCKSKSSSKVNISDESVENPLFLFDENLNIENRMKPLQLPPLKHYQNFKPTSHQFSLKHYQNEENETSKKKKKKKKKNRKTNVSIPPTLEDHNLHQGRGEVKNKKGKRKKKAQKTILKEKENDEYKFIPKQNSYSESTFPATISDLLTDFITKPRVRRMSVIDITDSQGKIEKTVEIDKTEDSIIDKSSNI